MAEEKAKKSVRVRDSGHVQGNNALGQTSQLHIGKHSGCNSMEKKLVQYTGINPTWRWDLGTRFHP